MKDRSGRVSYDDEKGRLVYWGRLARRPELYEFWQGVRHSRWMRHYGYDTLPDAE